MNVHLSPNQIAEINSITMSKRERLFRFAHLIRNSPISPLVIFSNIEHMSAADLRSVRHECSAFSLAARDPILKEAGLKSDTVAEAQKFFELSRDDLHQFSCDCGGHITNEQMARRVEAIAARA